MIREVIIYILMFLALVLTQVLVLNNIELGGYINPYLYVFFILALPFETHDNLVLVLAFVLGLTIDVFTSTLGIHTSATVFLAFSRKYVLKLISPRGGYDFGTAPNLQSMGMSWFMTYSIILVLCHHIFLFYVESFSFSQFFSTFARVILSSIFTLILVFIVQLFNYNPNARK
ncbi:MAG: rod shape-determining protein MreD [Flavobacteriales bacterium]|nr:MAG: rod shape-determining protein MreD [Flavobacteriales bacterium]